MLEYFFVGMAFFISGFIVGDRFRKMQWGMLDWRVMKWHKESLSYRLASHDAKVKRGEKAYIALKLDTDILDAGQEVDVFE